MKLWQHECQWHFDELTVSRSGTHGLNLPQDSHWLQEQRRSVVDIMEFGFCWAAYLWKIHGGLSSDVGSCGFFSDLQHGFMAFKAKPTAMARGRSGNVWKHVPRQSPGGHSLFIAGTCLRAKVTRKLIWDFVFRNRPGSPTLLGCFKWNTWPFLVFL